MAIYNMGKVYFNKPPRQDEVEVQEEKEEKTVKKASAPKKKSSKDKEVTDK